MPEPTLPDRLVTAAEQALADNDRYSASDYRVEARAAASVALREAATLLNCRCDYELLTELADEIEAIAANPANSDIESPGVAHHRHTEPEWCPHPNCHDRAHLDGVHTDEHGHPFRNRPEETP